MRGEAYPHCIPTVGLADVPEWSIVSDLHAIGAFMLFCGTHFCSIARVLQYIP